MVKPKKSTTRQIRSTTFSGTSPFVPSAEIDKVLATLEGSSVNVPEVQELEKFAKVLGKAKKLANTRSAMKLQQGELSRSIGEEGFQYLEQLESSTDLTFLRNEAVSAFATCKVLADRLMQCDQMFNAILPALMPVFKKIMGGDKFQLDIALSLREALDQSNAKIQAAIDAHSRGGAAVNQRFRQQKAEAYKWLETNFSACDSMRDASRKLIAQRIVPLTVQTSYEWVRQWNKSKKSSVR